MLLCAGAPGGDVHADAWGTTLTSGPRPPREEEEGELLWPGLVAGSRRFMPRRWPPLCFCDMTAVVAVAVVEAVAARGMRRREGRANAAPAPDDDDAFQPVDRLTLRGWTVAAAARTGAIAQAKVSTHKDGC